MGGCRATVKEIAEEIAAAELGKYKTTADICGAVQRRAHVTASRLSLLQQKSHDAVAAIHGPGLVRACTRSGAWSGAWG